ncbi:GNAT family N-acetyltransferase [Cupriavidus sp. 2TAF22]|uniref:bifunctional helix-turn-helix transcriptional regulator/GNAT family N-acetyltransferase n=1 Tax=unclassified Cupriavidus TaxID=2640874 RepID=UPI003F92148D
MDLIEPPPQSRDDTIAALRTFSRKLVRELGFMRSTLADSQLSPSAVHAIIEIGLAPGIQARDLASLLRLDKSNTSRQLAKLESMGLVTRTAADDDARSATLRLTGAGAQLRARIDQFATEQVSRALRRLTPADQQSLVRAVAIYADALAVDNASAANAGDASPGAGIVEGYQPGCIGDIASQHARFYAQLAGFGSFFEQKVATELAAFATALPSPDKGLWLYLEGGRTQASIAIDGDPASGLAHLRWFIADASLRGTGIGRQLLERALAFADARYAQTYLWTFQGLDAARHLYESAGFALADEAPGRQWGATVLEQRFVRDRAGLRN